MKTCCKCKIDKDEVSFTTGQLKKNKSKCKACVSEKGKAQRKRHPGKNAARCKKWAMENPVKKSACDKKWRKENSEKKKANDKKWQQDNPEKVAIRNKKWKKANAGKVKKSNKNWRKNNPEKVATGAKKSAKKNAKQINARRRDRYQNDITYKNKCIVSAMVYRMIKSQGGSKNGESSGDYFSWTSQEYRAHIESLFEPWMNWKNQGAYNPKTHHLPEKRTWQLDHIIPQSDLPFNSLHHSNLQKAWDLSNLRPLDSKQNLIDGVNRTRHTKKNSD